MDGNVLMEKILRYLNNKETSLEHLAKRTIKQEKRIRKMKTANKKTLEDFIEDIELLEECLENTKLNCIYSIEFMRTEKQ